jgi:signal transduction histidine kinase/PAS domain-containing protein
MKKQPASLRQPRSTRYAGGQQHAETAAADTPAQSIQEHLSQLEALYQLTAALSRAGALEDIYEAALTCLHHALGIERASILLFDPDGVMRFKAWRGLSETYRKATEGHTPWSRDTTDAAPILVPDVNEEPALAGLRAVVRGEGIRALAFVPLVHHSRLLGKFMLYYPALHQFSEAEIQLAQSIAGHIAVAVARRQAEEALSSSEHRLALAYQAARLGTFDWNIQTDQVVWSLGAETPAGALSGSYADWMRTLHSDDRERVEQALAAAVQARSDVDTEFRIAWPDGSMHWIALKGRLVCDEAGLPLRMIGVNEDITGRKRHEQTQGFLVEACQVLASSLDYEKTIQHVARIAVPTIADACIFYQLVGQGVLRRLTLAHVDPEKERLLRETQRLEIALDSDIPVARVVRSGRLEIASQLPPTIGETIHADPDYQAIVRKLAPHAYICVPLMAREHRLGAVAFVLTDRQRRFAATDLGLAEEIAQRAALALDNARLYQDAQDAIVVREQFLSIASHELRTPLTALLGNAEMLIQRATRDGNLPEREMRSVQVLYEQSMRLNKMISALLDISRLEQGTLSIEQGLVDLCALVGRVVEEVQPGLTLQSVECVIPHGLCLTIAGDELRLEQVLHNLINNALKYSAARGITRVRVEQRGDMAAVVVSDQGIGIPAADMPHLFERFYRASNANRQSISGMGIGLSIVNEIVSLHGGSVTVESTLGQGSTFTVCLPLQR